MLRGPQTAGELRARAARMAGFADAAEVESTLEALRQRTDGALVSRLAREPGRREVRYMHLLGPAGEAAVEWAEPASGREAHEPPATPDIAAAPTPGAAGRAGALPLESRVSALERSVARLSAELEELRRRQ